MQNEFEFSDKELDMFIKKLAAESELIIENIVAKHSPISIGDDVDVGGIVLRVCEIELCAQRYWEEHPNMDKLSFSYRGLPLGKNGEPMKNRKPVHFSHFTKDGKAYKMPSYSRVYFSTATMTTPQVIQKFHRGENKGAAILG